MAPSNPARIRVTKVTQVDTRDAAGKPIPGVRVAFMIGDHGPFQEDFPKADFTIPHVMPVLQKIADTINGLSNA